MALADALFPGGSLSQGYKKPISKEEKLMAITKGLEGLTKARESQADAALKKLQILTGGLGYTTRPVAVSEVRNLGEKTEGTKEVLPKSGKQPKILPAGQAEALAGIKEAILLSDEMPANIEKNKDVYGPLDAITSFGTNYEKRQMAVADSDKIRQILGKALEEGVLREGDWAKYQKILPNVWDTEKTAKYKAREMSRNLRSDFGTKLRTFGEAGYDVSRISSPVPQKEPNKKMSFEEFKRARNAK
jgi:hypothetical protein